MNKRNGEIDVLRFVFASIIMNLHFYLAVGKGFFSRGFIGVEFFFLVSGYFLAKAAMETEYNRNTLAGKTIRYTLRKAKGFLYYYFIVMVFVLMENIVFTEGYTIKNVVESIVRSLPHMTLITTVIGYKSPLYTMGMWYLSGMIVSVFILYPVIVRWKDIALLLFFPVLFLWGLGWMYGTNGILAIGTLEHQGIFVSGQLRSLIEMMMGASMYKLVKFLRHYHFGKSARLLLFVLKWSSYAIVFYYAGGCTNRNFDFHALGYLCIGVSISLSEVTYTISENRLTEWLARVSLSLYIFHPLVVRLLEYLYGDNVSSEMLCAFIGGTYLLAIVMMYITPMIRKACRNLWALMDIHRIEV